MQPDQRGDGQDVAKHRHHAYRFMDMMRVVSRHARTRRRPAVLTAVGAMGGQKDAGGRGLEFPILVMNTGMTLYHRFFMLQSMNAFNWLEMAWWWAPPPCAPSCAGRKHGGGGRGRRRHGRDRRRSRGSEPR